MCHFFLHFNQGCTNHTLRANYFLCLKSTHGIYPSTGQVTKRQVKWKRQSGLKLICSRASPHLPETGLKTTSQEAWQVFQSILLLLVKFLTRVKKNIHMLSNLFCSDQNTKTKLSTNKTLHNWTVAQLHNLTLFIMDLTKWYKLLLQFLINKIVNCKL